MGKVSSLSRRRIEATKCALQGGMQNTAHEVNSEGRRTINGDPGTLSTHCTSKHCLPYWDVSSVDTGHGSIANRARVQDAVNMP